MGYTHAARYKTVIIERGCRRCSQRKGPLPFKDAWENGWIVALQHIMHHAHPSTLAPGHLAALRVRTVWYVATIVQFQPSTAPHSSARTAPHKIQGR